MKRKRQGEILEEDKRRSIEREQGKERKSNDAGDGPDIMNEKRETREHSSQGGELSNERIHSTTLHYTTLHYTTLHTIHS